MPYNFVCATCDHPFVTPNKNRKYCCFECNFLGRRKKQERICEWCNVTYYATGKRNERFCSRICWGQDHAHKPTESVCETCGKTFTQPRTHNRKNCGKECADIATQKAQSHKQTKACEVCGKEFKHKPSRPGKFCSRACSDKGRDAPGERGKNKTFPNGTSKDYYGTNWYRQRRKARERDNYSCQHCGINEKKLGQQLDVHHIKMFKEFLGDYEKANQLTNLISLCRSCHRLAESRSIAIQLILL